MRLEKQEMLKFETRCNRRVYSVALQTCWCPFNLVELFLPIISITGYWKKRDLKWSIGEKSELGWFKWDVTIYSLKNTNPKRPRLQWTGVVLQLLWLPTESNADKSKLLLQRSAWVNQCNQTWCSNAQLQNTTSTNRFMVWKQLLFPVKTSPPSLKPHPFNDIFRLFRNSKLCFVWVIHSSKTTSSLNKSSGI